MKNGMKQTEIGEIPVEWEVVKLGEVASINQASLPNSTSEDYSFWYVDLSAVKQGAITFPQEQIRFGDSSPRARRKIKPGDVIVATVRPNLLGYAIVKFDTTDIICSTGFAIISPSQQVIGEFIYQWLYTDFLQNQISKLTVGSNYPAINSSDVAGFLMPLPPLPEQQKIAEILSTLDEKMAVMDEQLAQTQELKKGLMQRLLTQGIGHTQFKDSPLGEIPASWSLVKIDDILQLVERPLKMNDNEPYELVTVKRRFGGIVPRGTYLGEDVKVKTQFIIKENDFLISKRQIVHCACGIVPVGLDGAIVSNEYSVFNASNNLNLTFFNYYVQRPDIQKSFLLSSDGVHIEKMLFKVRDWVRTLVSLPPVKEQRQIAEILTTVDDKIGVLQDKKAQYHTLKKGLMQQLLTGQRRVRVAQEAAAA